MTPHGTPSTYTNHNCRCSECREANRLAVARRRAARRSWVAENGLPDGVAHGASAYSNWGCRCSECRNANAADKRDAYWRTRSA